MRQIVTVYVSVGILFILNSCSNQPFSAETLPAGTISFTSNDTVLVNRFNFAKSFALNYTDSAAVGLWYEAAPAGREAFCIRDVSHMAKGAVFLGLQNYTKNMFYKFAYNISDAKDWCTYYSINKLDSPVRDEFTNDKEFWYRLPANFDMLQSCYNQFILTGDKEYITNPVFLNFYKKTVNEYATRWNLQYPVIKTRERFMNLPDAFNRNNPYYIFRGLPTYADANAFKIHLGVDLLSAQFAALQSYSKLLAFTDKKADTIALHLKATEYYNYINSEWWDIYKNNLITLKYNDNTAFITPFVFYALYYNALGNTEQIVKVLDYLKKQNDIAIEVHSYYPEIFYKYGYSSDGYRYLSSLLSYDTYQREYPEASFATISTIVSGVMGVNANVTEDYIKSCSSFTSDTITASLTDLPLANRLISVTHIGNTQSQFQLLAGNNTLWVAAFKGDFNYIEINGDKIKAKKTNIPVYGIQSYVNVPVKQNTVYKAKALL